VDAFLRACPDARDLRRLAFRFRAMLRSRTVKRLAAWMRAARSSDVHFVGQCARVLGRDTEAVKQASPVAGVTGPSKDTSNRLKMIKRQMYGRAGFELLRARVLPWESTDNFKVGLHRKCVRSDLRVTRAGTVFGPLVRPPAGLKPPHTHRHIAEHGSKRGPVMPFGRLHTTTRPTLPRDSAMTRDLIDH
jgi:hypothetical protein